jgi:2-polyprenyl-3-methyl-5-hydroxy-6-metoxy-1,4-benzoquinol methylase
MSCPICGSGASWPIAYRSDSRISRWRSEIGDPSPDDWRLCCRCGNAFPRVQPELQVLQRVWQAKRAAVDTSPDEEAATWRNRLCAAQVWAERSYQLLLPLAPRGGRFLDVACGLGQTVRTFADHGWGAEGIDVDPKMRPFHEELEIDSRIGQFEKMELKGSYDLIHIAHAIYFITRPMNFIDIVRQHLTPDGLFCVAISDFMSNVDPDPPSYAHTFVPTGASMRYALAVAGFETVLSRRISGSIYIVARLTRKPAIPIIWPAGIRLLYRTKTLRYLLFGRPYVLLRRAVKYLIGPR